MKHLVTVFFSITLAQNRRDILRWKPWGCNTGAVFKYLSKEYFNRTDLSKLTHRVWNSHNWHLARSLLHLSMLHMCSTALQPLSQSARHRSNHGLAGGSYGPLMQLGLCFLQEAMTKRALIFPSTAWLCCPSSASRSSLFFDNLVCGPSCAKREETRDWGWAAIFSLKHLLLLKSWRLLPE